MKRAHTTLYILKSSTKTPEEDSRLGEIPSTQSLSKGPLLELAQNPMWGMYLWNEDLRIERS